MKISVNIKSYQHFGKKEQFFKNMEFSIDSNGLYFLIGSSGIGKTTLLNILLGLNDGYFDGCVKYKIEDGDNTPISIRKR
jgi:ABC-type multidrug transport system ATPase subunit